MPSLYNDYKVNKRPADHADAGEYTFVTPPQATMGQQAEIKLVLNVKRVELTNVKVWLIQEGIQAGTQIGSTVPALGQDDNSQSIPLGYQFVDVRAEVDSHVEYKLQFTPSSPGSHRAFFQLEADQLARAVTGNLAVIFVTAATPPKADEAAGAAEG